MRNVFWYAQNEVVDEDGFFAEGVQFVKNELAYLKEEGCPGTDAVDPETLFVEIHDRDTASLEGDVPDEMAEWLEAEGLLETFDD